MYWIVRIDNPKPEVYIPIFICKSFDYERFSNQEKFKVFKVEREAIAHAHTLLVKFSIEYIRLFYEEGHSERYK